MKRKTASQVLHEVDPSLKVIPGGVRRGHKRKKKVKLDEISHVEMPVYNPTRSSDDDWNDAGGVICPICRKEATQLLPYGSLGIFKACPECIKTRERMVEHKRSLALIRDTDAARRLRLQKPRI